MGQPYGSTLWVNPMGKPYGVPEKAFNFSPIENIALELGVEPLVSVMGGGYRLLRTLRFGSLKQEILQ